MINQPPFSQDSQDTDFTLPEKSGNFLSSQSSGLRRGSKFTQNSNLTVEESSLAAILEETDGIKHQPKSLVVSKTSSRDSGVQFSIGSSTLSTSARTSSISDDKKSIPDIIEEVELDEIENGIKEFKLDEPGESNSIQNFTLNDFTESIGTSDQDSSSKTKIFAINTGRFRKIQ